MDLGFSHSFYLVPIAPASIKRLYLLHRGNPGKPSLTAFLKLKLNWSNKNGKALFGPV